MNINEINELSDNFENLMEKILFINERARFEHIKFIKSVISSSFENKPIAEFRIFAEEDIALEEARKECGQILDLLRFSSQFFHYRNTISIGFEGEIIRGNYPLIMHKANFYGYNIPNEYKGPLHNFEIDNYKIQHLEKIGILKLSKILEKSDSDKTGFENILLLALHWFSNFMTQKQIENQFLSLMITLEIFLTPGGERVSSYISDAAARILKLGLKDRKELKDEITKFYTKRSNIVHGKRDKMPDSDDVNQLQEIVARLLLWMIKKSQIFKDKDDLLKYIEKRKLA